MGKIVKEVKKEVIMQENRFSQDKRIEEFERMNETFEELVKRGIAKKRGNQLLSASDAHLKREFRLNTPDDAHL